MASQRGREMGDDHVQLTGQLGDACGDALVLFEVRVGIPARGQVEIRYPVVKQDGRMPPEVRTPLRAVEAQPRDLGRVVVEIIKSLVVVGELAPEGLDLLPAGMVILVVAGHENHRGPLELAVDERHAVEPPAVHDIAGEYQHIPGCIGRELLQGIRQVPFPEFKMQIRCNLDFHGDALRARACGPCRRAWPLLHLPPGLVTPGPGPWRGGRVRCPGPGVMFHEPAGAGQVPVQSGNDPVCPVPSLSVHVTYPRSGKPYQGLASSFCSCIACVAVLVAGSCPCPCGV